MRVSVGSFLGTVLSPILILLVLSACGTSDAKRLKEARESYLKDDFTSTEKDLYTKEVYENDNNRLMHYYLLSSVAMSQGQFEKAAVFLNKARASAISVRSANGTIDWFSAMYRSNPVEFSYIHYELVMAYALLAQAGETPAWSTPEMKDEKGNVIVAAVSAPARKFSPNEISQYRDKARAELGAWNAFIEDLKNTYPTQNFYKEDMWARMLGSFILGSSGDHNDKRTGELLVNDARKVFDQEFKNYPSFGQEAPQVQTTLDKLTKNAKAQSSNQSLFVLEAGVMSKYKVKRFLLGLSTIFSHIQNPHVRSLMEQVGMQAILATAPEFGLIVLAGGVAGAVEGSSDDDSEFDGPPRFFSDAVDRGIGFEIQFPSMIFPPADTRVSLQLTAPGSSQPVFSEMLPQVSPLQEIIASDLKNREDSEMFAQAVKIGGQYLAILIPAIITYRAAGRKGNLLQKLAVVAGYYVAKKAIDHANKPDLRSWEYLPKLIAADVIDVKPGAYATHVSIQNHFGKYDHDFGTLEYGAPQSILRERVGDLTLLNQRDRPNKMR
jgi:hypothetical protein